MYQKSQSYELVFLETEWDRHNFFSFWAISCTFTPLIIIPPQKKKLKKWKRIPGDITTLYMCTIYKNHMMYSSWDMECDGQNFLSFWIIFCPFTPLTTWKIKIFKKWKNYLEISIYKSVPNIMIICYTVPEIWCVTHVVFIFQFGLFFTLLPPSNLKN